MSLVTANDELFIRKSIELSQAAILSGNRPFAACLVKDGEVLLTAENTLLNDGDVTHHAELNLVSLASRNFDRATLSQCTLYSSTEPCGMCAGAIYWSGIPRIVFGCSVEALTPIAGKALGIPCREVLAQGERAIEVVGPVLEEEALAVHRRYWSDQVEPRR